MELMVVEVRVMEVVRRRHLRPLAGAALLHQPLVGDREGDLEDAEEQGDRVPLGTAESQVGPISRADDGAFGQKGGEGRRIRCHEIRRRPSSPHRFPVGMLV